MMIYYLYVHSYMFRSYDHQHAEKYIATFQPDDGRTTETCSYVHISNISSYDIKVA
jgi:hypothetical protein